MRAMWMIFLCVQIVGILAMHLGPDWPLVLGVALLLPGLPGFICPLGFRG